jgi:exosortase/archaeosortase family protein
MWKRVLLAAAVVPMAVLTNALRLTIVLFAGAHHSAAVAQWIHDHEGPVLIALCAVGLIGIRHLLTWKPASDDQSRASQERASDETLPAADH